MAHAAWLAGIIDGEGTIGLLISSRADRLGRKQLLKVDPRVVVGNTDQGIIDRCVEALQALGVGVYVRHNRLAPKIGHPGFNPTKPVTTVHVHGFKRIRTLLNAILPYLAGEKRKRSELLLTFINGRLESSEASGKASNVSYTEKDVSNALAFLQLTRTKNLAHTTKLLNEHTREARLDHRRAKRREYYKTAAERGYIRPSRCALVSRESVRVAGNEQPPLELSGQ